MARNASRFGLCQASKAIEIVDLVESDSNRLKRICLYRLKIQFRTVVRLGSLRSGRIIKNDSCHSGFSTIRKEEFVAIRLRTSCSFHLSWVNAFILPLVSCFYIIHIAISIFLYQYYNTLLCGYIPQRVT